MARQGPRALLVAAQPVAGAAGWLRSCPRSRGKAVDRQLAASPSADGAHACHVPRAARACRVHSCMRVPATRCTVPTYRDKHKGIVGGHAAAEAAVRGLRARTSSEGEARLPQPPDIRQGSLPRTPPALRVHTASASDDAAAVDASRGAVRRESALVCGSRLHVPFASPPRPTSHVAACCPTPPHCTHVAADLRT